MDRNWAAADFAAAIFPSPHPLVSRPQLIYPLVILADYPLLAAGALALGTARTGGLGADSRGAGGDLPDHRIARAGERLAVWNCGGEHLVAHDGSRERCQLCRPGRFAGASVLADGGGPGAGSAGLLPGQLGERGGGRHCHFPAGAVRDPAPAAASARAGSRWGRHTWHTGSPGGSGFHRSPPA